MIKKTIFACFLTLFATSVLAEDAAQDFYSQDDESGIDSVYKFQFGGYKDPFKLHPRLTFWGMTGSKTSGEVQGMLPIASGYGWVLYTAAEASEVFGTSRWMADVGLGYRVIVEDNLYGAYLFADYLRSNYKGDFFVLNPGIESLGEIWDFDANLYFPLSRQKVLSDVWADELGDYSHIRYEGHKQLNKRTRLLEEMGRGVDAEIGRFIPRISHLKAYLGGYYFKTQELGSVTGALLRFNYEFNKHTALEFVDSYDKEAHNQVFLGVRITFGGYSDEEKSNFGLQTRLLDPVMHNLVTIAGTTPILNKKELLEKEMVQHDKIWFFKKGDQNFSSGKGTVEDPFNLTTGNYASIDPNLGQIDKYPLLYFEGASYSNAVYSLDDFSSRGIDGRLALPNGWGMYGKTDSTYIFPSTGIYDNPYFRGGIDLNYAVGEGKVANCLQSITIANSGIDAVGDNVENVGKSAALYVKNADEVNLKNVVVYDIAGGDDLNPFYYVVGIYSENSRLNFTGENNTILVQAFSAFSGIGIYAISGSEINFLGGENSIDAAAVNDDAAFGVGVYLDQSNLNFIDGGNAISGRGLNAISSFGYGIYANADAEINFNGGDKNSITGAANTSSVASVGGILAQGNSVVNFNGGDENDINATVLGDFVLGGVGLHLNDNSEVNFNGGVNNIHSTVSSFSFGNAYGINAAEDCIVNFKGGDNTIGSRTAGFGDGSSYGVYLFRRSSMSVTGGINDIEAEAKGAADNTAYGLYVENFSTATFEDGDTSILGKAGALGTLSIGYGVYIDDNSVLDFNNLGKSAIAIGAGGIDEAYGIYAGSDVDLQISSGGIVVTSLGDFETNGVVVLTRSSGTTGGFKIRWISVGDLPWPP